MKKMKRLRKLSGIALVLLVGAPGAALAQVPAVPVVPAPAPAAAVPVTPVAAAPARNLWSFLCLTPEQMARCKARFCGSQFGQLISNLTMVKSALTGGVIPQCCPGPVGDPANLLKPPNQALGAAARVQADTAAAAARRAAVRYLSTVDCNYWPEARAALIDALRADRNECVRLEAALALQRGCCCNQETIKALVLTVSGGRDDDNPAEDSPRVRAAALAALEHCLCCYVSITPAPVPPPPPPPVPLPERPAEKVPAPEGPPPPQPLPPPSPVVPPPAVPAPAVPAPAVPAPAVPAPATPPPVRPASYYARVQNLSIQEVVLEARQTVQKAKAAQAAAVTAAVAARGVRERSLSEVFENAFHPPTPPAAPTRPSAAPPAREPSQMRVEPPILIPVPTNPTRAPVPRGTIEWEGSPIVPPPVPLEAGPCDPSQTLALLRGSTNPEVREWAAASLAQRGEPTPSVVQELASSAVLDGSAEVRLACLRGLLKLRAAAPTLAVTASRLQGDRDARVRDAAKTLDQWLQSQSAAPMAAPRLQ
jgi:hypothetical protein